MRKITIAAISVLVTGSLQTAVHAEEAARDWAVSVYGGMMHFVDTETRPDPYRPHLMSHEIESDDGYKIGFKVSKYYCPNVSVDLGIEFTNEIEDVADGKDVLGEHSHVPIYAGANYHFNTVYPVTPYIGAGIGYSFNDGTESDFLAQQGLHTETDDSFFYFLTAGLEYALNDRYALFAAGQYSLGDMEGKGTMPGLGQMEDEQSMDRYEFNIGVKYFF